MGMLSLFFVLLLSGGALAILRQKLESRSRNCRESFAALKMALACRHQAVRLVLEAAQLYLIGDTAVAERLAAACADAERKLGHAVRYFSAEPLVMLARAENELNAALRQLQACMAEKAGRGDAGLKKRLEMLDAAEGDVVHSRRSYNRAAEHYNQLLLRFPLNRFAALLGHNTPAAAILFEDNNVTQMSRELLV